MWNDKPMWNCLMVCPLDDSRSSTFRVDLTDEDERIEVQFSAHSGSTAAHIWVTKATREDPEKYENVFNQSLDLVTLRGMSSGRIELMGLLGDHHDQRTPDSRDRKVLLIFTREDTL